MVITSVSTYRAQIWIAGDYDQARQQVREFCLAEGFCATVTATTFIYTGGEEAGVCVGCLDYPRLPVGAEKLWDQASRLATLLMHRMCQHSVLICADDKTEWLSRRPSEPRPA
jgi:hypothetical protein